MVKILIALLALGALVVVFDVEPKRYQPFQLPVHERNNYVSSDNIDLKWSTPARRMLYNKSLETVSPQEVFDVAGTVGWRGQDRTRITLHAGPESSFKPRAVGIEDPNDRCVVQVNIRHHADILERFGLEPEDLFDLHTCLRVALAVYEKQGWSAWSKTEKKALDYEYQQNILSQIYL